MSFCADSQTATALVFQGVEADWLAGEGGNLLTAMVIDVDATGEQGKQGAGEGGGGGGEEGAALHWMVLDIRRDCKQKTIQKSASAQTGYYLIVN